MTIWRLWASSYAFDSLLNKTVSSACINFFVLDQLNLRILSEEIIELQQLTCRGKKKKTFSPGRGFAVWCVLGPHFISASMTSSSRICQHRRAKIYEPRIYGFLHQCKTSSCLFQAWKGNTECALVKLFLYWLRLITQTPEMKAESLTEMSCTQSGVEICVVMSAWFLSLLQNTIVGWHGDVVGSVAASHLQVRLLSEFLYIFSCFHVGFLTISKNMLVGEMAIPDFPRGEWMCSCLYMVPCDGLPFHP